MERPLIGALAFALRVSNVPLDVLSSIKDATHRWVRGGAHRSVTRVLGDTSEGEDDGVIVNEDVAA